MNFLTIFRTLGLGHLLMAVLMIAPLIAALVSGDGMAGSFFFAILATAFVGAGFYLIGQKDRDVGADIREAMLAILMWWVGAPIMAAVPFMLGGLAPIDAYVEAVSALTTTGAWISEAGARAHVSGGLWRAILQWYGGLISLSVAAAIFIRPLFLGIDTVQAPFNRGENASHTLAFHNAFSMFFSVYAMISVFCFSVVTLAGAPSFDGLIMALSIPASGGFVWASGGFENYALPVQLAAFGFIVLSGVNFILVASFAHGRRQRLRDRETLAYGAAIVGVGLLFWFLIGQGGLMALPVQVFNAASILSTNGLTLGAAPPFSAALVTVVIGGAAVSTAGGIKILRWLVVIGRAREEIDRLVSPNGVFSTRNEVDVLGVWIHFLAFTFVLAALTLLMTAGGETLERSAAAAAAALSNAGPLIHLTEPGVGLERFAASELKLVLALGMILGRVEAISALVLFNHAFWRS